MVEFYTLARSVTGASGGAVASAVTNFEQLVELGAATDPDANDQHIVKIVDWLLQYAYDQRASDIHIEPLQKESRVRYRIDGALIDANLPQEARHFLAAILSRIKIMAQLDIAEKRLPQDGRISLRIGGRAIDVRVSTLPGVHGERAVLRLLDKGEAKFSLPGLGMQGDTYTRFSARIQQPHGIVLVTGPTGSGKTTTLYAALNELNSPEKKVITVEDPVEYRLPGLNQVQVMDKIDLLCFMLAGGITLTFYGLAGLIAPPT